MSPVRTIFGGIALATLAFVLSAVLSVLISIPYRTGDPVEPLRPGTVLTEEQFHARALAGEASLAAAKETTVWELFRFGAAFYFAVVAPAFIAACAFSKARRTPQHVLLLIAPALVVMFVLGVKIYGLVLLVVAAAILLAIRRPPPSEGTNGAA